MLVEWSGFGGVVVGSAHALPCVCWCCDCCGVCVIVDVVGVRCCWGEAKNARKLPKNVWPMSEWFVSLLPLFVTKERAKIKKDFLACCRKKLLFFFSAPVWPTRTRARGY